MAWIDKLVSAISKADVPRAKKIYETLPQMAEAYSPAAVQRAIETTPPKQLIELTPREFRALSFPLDPDQAAPYVAHYADLLRNKRWTEPPPGLFMDHYLDWRRGQPLFEGFADVPFLQVRQDPTVSTASQVVGHEGRHRFLAKDEVFPPDTNWLTRILGTYDPLPPTPRSIFPQGGTRPSLDLSSKRRFADGGLIPRVGALGRMALKGLRSANTAEDVGSISRPSIMGQRGAASLGIGHYQRLLDEEFNSAAKMERAGQDSRMRSASPSPQTWTGYDLKPRIEMDTQGFTPKIHTPTLNSVPLPDAWNLEPWFPKAYQDLVDKVRVLHSPDDPLGSGHFDPLTGQIMVGMNQDKLYPKERQVLQQSPHILDEIMTKTLGHELLGHAVASQENFTPGSSPDAIKRIMQGNHGPQARKTSLRAEFLTELASGSDPMRIVEKYVKIRPDLKDQMLKTVGFLISGHVTPPDLLKQAEHLRNDAKRYQASQAKTDQINTLVNGDILTLGPPDVLRAAQELEKTEGPEAAKAFIGYRANAGENEADLIGSRMAMDGMAKQDKPLVSQNMMLNRFLHSISR